MAPLGKNQTWQECTPMSPKFIRGCASSCMTFFVWFAVFQCVASVTTISHRGPSTRTCPGFDPQPPMSFFSSNLSLCPSRATSRGTHHPPKYSHCEFHFGSCRSSEMTKHNCTLYPFTQNEQFLAYDGHLQIVIYNL